MKTNYKIIRHVLALLLARGPLWLITAQYFPAVSFYLCCKLIIISEDDITAEIKDSGKGP